MFFSHKSVKDYKTNEFLFNFLKVDKMVAYKQLYIKSLYRFGFIKND